MKRKALESARQTKFQLPASLPTLKDPQAGIVLNTLMSLLRKWAPGFYRLSFGDAQTGMYCGNFDAIIQSFVTPSPADTEFELPHALGRVPVGFFPVFKDKACDIYAVESQGWNDSTIKIKASAADASVKLWIF